MALYIHCELLKSTYFVCVCGGGGGGGSGTYFFQLQAQIGIHHTNKIHLSNLARSLLKIIPEEFEDGITFHV